MAYTWSAATVLVRPKLFDYKIVEMKGARGMKVPLSYTEEQEEAISEWRHDSVPHEMIYQDVRSGGVAVAYALIMDGSTLPPQSVIRLSIEPNGELTQTDGTIQWPDDAYDDEEPDREPSVEQERAWNEIYP